MNRQQFSDEEVQFLDALERAMKEMPPVLDQLLMRGCHCLVSDELATDQRIKEMYGRLWMFRLCNTVLWAVVAIHERWSDSLCVLRGNLTRCQQRLQTTFSEIYRSRLLISVKMATRHVEENCRETEHYLCYCGGSAVVLMAFAWMVAATVEIGIRQGTHQCLLLSALNSASLILAILAVVLASVPIIAALSVLPLAVWVFLRIESLSEDHPLHRGR